MDEKFVGMKENDYFCRWIETFKQKELWLEQQTSFPTYSRLPVAFGGGSTQDSKDREKIAVYL